ncbi:imelysin family protein [Jiella sonneratiae]|uniref:Peptidase M75, Imelysin n=1 Tax=Jiella sonneratiae TaxID=2816856 RepID=A0ABS3J4E0_9HYPH|nr:imelysin family protein [Jiella sonneratiae]MBO0904545.1 peptidase M75, Imelysin [Jiella sonneratiae]
MTAFQSPRPAGRKGPTGRRRLPGRLFAALLIALPLLVGPAAAQEETAVQVTNATREQKLDVVWNAVDGAIRPGYAAFVDAAKAEEDAVADLCKLPAGENLQGAREAFADLVKAWSRVEFVQFGPVMEDNRGSRILFFPDRRGIGLRQVQAIIADKDESATTPDGLYEKSVAVQGLGALEYVLYGTGADVLAGKDGNFRCRFGKAIAHNLVGIGTAIRGEWAKDEGGIVQRLTEPKDSDPAYRSADDSLKEIVGVFINGFEAIRDLRLKPAMGDSEKAAKPNLLLFHRAELALVSLEADFAGMKQLFTASNVASLLPEAHAYLKDSILFEFENAEMTFGKLSPPLAKVLTTASQRQGLTYLLIVTDSLQSQFAGQLSPLLGLSAGFSALDGD